MRPYGVVPIALMMLAGSAVAASDPAIPPQPSAVIDIEAEDCLQIPPQEIPPLATSVDEVLPLEVRVLAEPEDQADAREYIRMTKTAFARIGIKMKTRFETVLAPAEWSSGTGLGAGPNQEEILSFMKDHYGGRRPIGTDIVYFITRHWDGGFADCIGGVRFPERAFAFGSIDYAVEGVVPSPTVDEGVIAAHEIGHLLGAHHHYSNCSEALPMGAPRGEINPCTVMSPLAATLSSTFGLLERSFVRAFTKKYADG